MAGGKKKKKPAANSARGFATTSIASKPRLDPAEAAAGIGADAVTAPKSSEEAATTADAPTSTAVAGNTEPQLSPEEFESQLEESELQLLVEKHAQKVKRDALRQKSRLETDRRLLRGQAEPVNSKKWLPPELMDHILDLIQAEGRFAASSVGSEGASGKLLPEEDLTIKLWTLQQTLVSAGFADEKVQASLKYVLDIAPQVGSGSKDSTWGLDEALDWLARECALDDLPDYDKHGKASGKSQIGTPPQYLPDAQAEG